MKNMLGYSVFLGVLVLSLCTSQAQDEEIFKLIKARDSETAVMLLMKDPLLYANARSKGETTPLHWAAIYGLPSVVKTLLDNNAEVNSRSGNGSTPLHWAARRNMVTIADILIKHGADIEAKTQKGYTALHWAAIGNSAKVARILLDNGAEIDAKAEDGSTPLHWAIRHEAYETMEILIMGGADIFARANSGATPFYWIQSKEGRKQFEALIAKRSETPPVKPKTADAAKPRPTPQAAQVPANNTKITLPETRKEALADGGIYDGSWKKNLMHGEGTLVYSDGRWACECDFGIYRKNNHICSHAVALFIVWGNVDVEGS